MRKSGDRTGASVLHFPDSIFQELLSNSRPLIKKSKRELNLQMGLHLDSFLFTLGIHYLAKTCAADIFIIKTCFFKVNFGATWFCGCLPEYIELFVKFYWLAASRTYERWIFNRINCTLNAYQIGLIPMNVFELYWFHIQAGVHNQYIFQQFPTTNITILLRCVASFVQRISHQILC